MESLYLIIFFLLGVLSTIYIPKFIRSFYYKEKKEYDVTFRLDWYCQPSMYNSTQKGKLIKSPNITIKIRALDETEALSVLDGAIKQEVKGELISIKEVEKKSNEIFVKPVN